MGKEMAILTNKYFFSLGVLSFILCAALFLRVGTLRAQHSKCHPRHFFIFGSSLVFSQRKIGKVQRKGILIIVLFDIKRRVRVYSAGHSALKAI